MKTIGVDVGGTFTDIVLWDVESGEVATHKVSTTPHDPSQAVMRGVVEICEANRVALRDVGLVLHGTTTATNAVLENKGARAGLITNEGFRDILHIARHQRVEHYSIMQQLPWQSRPLVKRRHRKTVKGRLAPPTGAEIEPLDEEGVRQAALQLRAENVESVAVCFLFSYLNPAHEERARTILSQALPDAFITTSASVAPQFREFERFTTTALSAFIGPKMRNYISNLEDGLRAAGMGGDLRIMASNGGVATPTLAAEKPAVTLLSGLAAGVLGGAWVGKFAKRDRLITFDMGGTSADIGLVVDGQLSEKDARSASIAGFPLLLPMIDVHTIGAGGGSLAYLDRGGAFRVGPQSAGAVPGPAAYGKGGQDPTVTDANVVLGRLDPDGFLGGSMKLDAAASEQAIGRLAEQLNMDPLEAAEGIITVVNSNMANAIRSRTVQKGIDPRRFSLVAFGGAGPLHAVEVAASLGIPEVVVPTFPGIASAMGLLTTDLKYEAIRTHFQVRNAVDLERLNSDFAAMESTLAAQFRTDGIDESKIDFQRRGDLRYAGQGYELSIAFPNGVVRAEDLELVWHAFHNAHRAEYGHASESNLIEIVNARVTAIGQIPKISTFKRNGCVLTAPAAIKPRRCVFRTAGRLSAFETNFYRRDSLPAQASIEGPAIILQTDSTTVVPPEWRANVDDIGNLIIGMGKR